MAHVKDRDVLASSLSGKNLLDVYERGDRMEDTLIVMKCRME